MGSFCVHMELQMSTLVLSVMSKKFSWLSFSCYLVNPSFGFRLLQSFRLSFI
jgi:hypothetical protein